jgi:hypothetical protein
VEEESYSKDEMEDRKLIEVILYRSFSTSGEGG